MNLAAALRTGLARATRARLLLVLALASALPAALFTVPAWRFLASRLDRALGADALSHGLSAAVLPDLTRSLEGAVPLGAMQWGLVTALVAALVIAPVVAAAVVAEAGSLHSLSWRGLLSATGDRWGRMARMALVAALPLGIAGGGVALLAWLAHRAGERALTEAAAASAQRWAIAGAVVLLFLAHLTLDAGRAWMVARPGRRSAFLAWVAGSWLLLRRPLRTLSLGLAGGLLGPGLGLAVMALRERLPAGPAWATVAGVLLAQVAAAAVGWGRAVRVAALAELARQDAEERRRR